MVKAKSFPIFLGLILVGLFWLVNVKSAAAENCSDSASPWNIDQSVGSGAVLTQKFSCQCLTVADKEANYTRIEDADCAGACGACSTDASCVCVRPFDCAAALNGQCLKQGTDDAKISNLKAQGWHIVQYRCPGNNTNVCYVAPSPDVTPTVTVANCCRNIVPPLDASKYNYSLNHLVQVAINIYDCILCVVGSLILLMLILGGVALLISAGNANTVALGKKIIAGAIIGGIIVFASYLIVNFTVKALGASFANENNIQISPGK